MLKKSNRLTTKFQFNITKKYGVKYWSTSYVCFVLTPKTEEQKTKVGFVVANTVHKKAARRNRAKRLLREALRKKLHRLPVGKWIVFIANFNIINKTYEELSAEIDKTIQKIPGTN